MMDKYLTVLLWLKLLHSALCEHFYYLLFFFPSRCSKSRISGGKHHRYGIGSSSSRVPVPEEMGVVLKEKLEEVLGGDRWKINNYLDKTHKPNQIYAILKQATGFIGAHLPYNLVTNNCEHFATDLRYGKRRSLQVINAGAGLGGTLAGLVLFSGMLEGTLMRLSRR